MNTDQNARCGSVGQFIPLIPQPQDSEWMAKMKETMPFLHTIPSTPQDKEVYFYRLWMEGLPKFEVIHQDDDKTP